MILKSVGASLGIKASKSSWDVAVIFKVEEGSSIWESWHLIRLSKIPCQSLTNRVGNYGKVTGYMEKSLGHLCMYSASVFSVLFSLIKPLLLILLEVAYDNNNKKKKLS